ncbi:MAG: hypothetical protein AAGD06_14105 [Acidobacteriota bacterium]
MSPLARDRLLGLLLFAFIPLVLFLFVARPEPLGASLAAGVALMVGHRWLARPYMHRVRRRKCLWSNGDPDASGEGAPVTLEHGGGTLEARCRRRHLDDLGRVFTVLWRWRWPLRLGIFVPLLLLLGSLTAAALGAKPPWSLATVTAVFQLAVGLTVHLPAYGYLALRRDAGPLEPLRVPFPVHNFFLLGVSNLLWVFRLVGAIWIYRGATALFGGT